MDKLDIKLWTLEAKGHIVPDRSLLKTPQQIEAIKKSAALNTAVLDHVAAHIKAGMSTAEIDKLVYDFTKEHGGIPAPLGYEGFPKSVCTSINNVVCHGSKTVGTSWRYRSCDQFARQSKRLLCCRGNRRTWYRT